MIQHEIQNFQHDVALLQYYIDRRQKTGFFDMEKLIEVFAITLFQATHKINLEDLNFRLTNFPAIDLGDKSSKTSVQVTSNATPRKINETISKFESHGLDKTYDKLIILGFCRASKANVPPYCQVIDMDDATNLLMQCTDPDAIQNVIDAIRRHHNYSKLHPFDDKNCLEIILNCVDRNAIKHRMSCEGSYTDMVSGLNEISELISKGQIKRHSKSKSLDDFLDNKIQNYLREVRDSISQILAIINSKKRMANDFVCLDHGDMMRIDRLKEKIIYLSNDIAKEKQLQIKISAYGL